MHQNNSNDFLCHKIHFIDNDNIVQYDSTEKIL